MIDPTYLAAAIPVALSALSTVHTFLDKHPRVQATAKLLAHLAGPLNLPAMRDAVVDIARAIVAHEDGDDATALVEAEKVVHPLGPLHVEVLDDGRTKITSPVPPPLPKEPEPTATTGTVKSWA